MPEIKVLKKRKDFIRVAKQGQKVVAKTIILQAALNFCTPPESRIGLTATKKLGKAHLRNRVKRRIRAALREIFKNTKPRPADFVVIGRYNTAACNFLDLKKDLENSIRKINTLFPKEAKSHEKSSSVSADSPH